MSYANVNGVSMYYEDQGSGDPLLLLHGGIAGGEIFAEIAPEFAASGRRVIVPDLQGHGRTADIDRPLRAESLADDVAALVGQLGLERADVMGYSLGGEVTWRLAIQHPDKVRRIVVISTPCRRDGSFPEVLAAMDAMSAEMAPMMHQSPAYQHYAAHAPRPEDWPKLIGRTAEMLKVDFDWTGEVARIEAPTMLVFADSDSVMPDHVAELFRLRGGGLRDAGWDGSGRPVARLAVLPGRTHYDVIGAPGLVPAVLPFLDEVPA